MQCGVQSDRIIFANPTKCPSHIKFAKKKNISQMTVDGELELLKIKDLYPEAKYVKFLHEIFCWFIFIYYRVPLNFTFDRTTNRCHLIEL